MKRLKELCLAWALPAHAEPKLATLLDLLMSAPDAPTSVTAPARALDVHVVDSFDALPLLRARPSLQALVDLGSGAGFPGLPLALAMPHVRVDLLEATRRKCDFLERALEQLELGNARVVCRRAEVWGAEEGSGAYDAAVVRAVGRLPTLVEYAAPLLREGGLLVAWKGRRDPDDERAGSEAADVLGLRLRGVTAVEPRPGASRRHLHVYEKVAPTPVGYPRRPGVARKRPLGG